MNAFKRRRSMRKNTSTDRLSNDTKNADNIPTFESIVQRVMRMRINEGVEPINESPPDIPIKGATMGASSLGNRNQGQTHHGRSHHRRVILLHEITPIEINFSV